MHNVRNRQNTEHLTVSSYLKNNSNKSLSPPTIGRIVEKFTIHPLIFLNFCELCVTPWRDLRLGVKSIEY